jgi:hypothetical protein
MDKTPRAFNVRDKGRHLFENVLVLSMFSEYELYKGEPDDLP